LIIFFGHFNIPLKFQTTLPGGFSQSFNPSVVLIATPVEGNFFDTLSYSFFRERGANQLCPACFRLAIYLSSCFRVKG